MARGPDRVVFGPPEPILHQVPVTFIILARAAPPATPTIPLSQGPEQPNLVWSNTPFVDLLVDFGMDGTVNFLKILLVALTCYERGFF